MKPGDVVVSVPMTVESVDGRWAVCSWFVGSELVKQRLRVDMLRKEQPTRRAPKGKAAKKNSRVETAHLAAADDIADVRRGLERLARSRPAGDLLLLPDLRLGIGIGLPKERFDRAVLALARRGEAVLHHHDHPHAIDEVDRELLVYDPAGRVSRAYTGAFYVGIAPRVSKEARHG